jgi:type I restriction enzyme R subunit
LFPQVFYTQLVLGLNKNSAMYATTGTASKFWGVWKESFSNVQRSLINDLLNNPLPDKVAEKIAQSLKIEKCSLNHERKTTASKADTIAHATKKVITEKMDEDSAFYEKLSKLIQQAIEDFRAKRISDLDYLNKVVGKVHDDMPDKLSGNEDAMAYFGVLKPFLEKHELSEEDLEYTAAGTAITIHGILEKHKKVHFWDDEDAQKQTVNEIDDYLYDELKTKRGIELSLDQMDDIIENALQVAKHRSYK